MQINDGKMYLSCLWHARLRSAIMFSLVSVFQLIGFSFEPPLRKETEASAEMVREALHSPDSQYISNINQTDTNTTE